MFQHTIFIFIFNNFIVVKFVVKVYLTTLLIPLLFKQLAHRLWHYMVLFKSTQLVISPDRESNHQPFCL